MKFSCDKNIIFSEISNAKDFISQKTADNQYSYVSLEIINDDLIIKTTDQKIGFYSSLKIDKSEEGLVLIKCDNFLEVLRNLPNCIINFENEKNILYIKPENSKIEIKLFVLLDSRLSFATIPNSEDFFNISQSVFTDMINSVIFAVSEDESKYNMTGVYLEQDDKSLTMVATDSRRLSYINKKLDYNIPEFDGIIIPTKFLNIIKKQSEIEGEFQICVKPTTLFIKNKNCIYFTNLIGEEFPAFRRVIPNALKNKCIVNKNRLEDAIKRSVTVIDDNKFKKIIINIAEDLMTICSVDTTSIGNAIEEIPCDYKGEPIKFGINYSYFLSPLKIINTENISLEFTSLPRPFIIKSVPEDDSFHLIMPMTVTD